MGLERLTSLREIGWAIENLLSRPENLLDLAIVSLVFFTILQLVRGTRAATLLRGIGIVLVLVWSLSFVLSLQAVGWLLSRTLTALAVALPVIFQEELRRWLDQLGRALPFLGEDVGSDDRPSSLVGEIADAARNMSRRRHGALVVLERDTGLQEYADSGVPLDARVTSELLQTTFFPNTALHDGAVIIRRTRAIAAAVTLPVSSARKLPDRRMGLRHRAALGISEVSDAICLIVSEETGRISLVVSQRFIPIPQVDRLPVILGKYIEEPNGGRLSGIFNALRGNRVERAT